MEVTCFCKYHGGNMFLEVSWRLHVSESIMEVTCFWKYHGGNMFLEVS